MNTVLIADSGSTGKESKKNEQKKRSISATFAENTQAVITDGEELNGSCSIMKSPAAKMSAGNVLNNSGQ